MMYTLGAIDPLDYRLMEFEFVNAELGFPLFIAF
jgi:hypothetical protein